MRVGGLTHFDGGLERNWLGSVRGEQVVPSQKSAANATWEVRHQQRAHVAAADGRQHQHAPAGRTLLHLRAWLRVQYEQAMPP